MSPADPEIDPQIRLGLVQGDDLDKWSGWVAALNVQRPPRFRETEDETAWAIFVLGVVFDDFALAANSFFHLPHTYVSDDALEEVSSPRMTCSPPALDQ